MAARADEGYQSVRNSGNLRPEEAGGHSNKLTTNAAESGQGAVWHDLTMLLSKS